VSKILFFELSSLFDGDGETEVRDIEKWRDKEEERQKCGIDR
jgi:hypothetical protein